MVQVVAWIIVGLCGFLWFSGLVFWGESRSRQRRVAQEQRILDLLQASGEMSGYELGKAAEIGSGSLYPSLMEMERDGRIVSRWGIATAERGWHRPRLYRINKVA